MKAQPPTRDEWLEALGEAVKPVDPDALTIHELCERFGMGRQAASRRMAELVQQRKAIRTWKMVDVRRVPAYKLVTP